ncbi:DUF3761 domain-containing protein [Mycobacterium heckeshornense]|uniref:DUF3761 domain-containing protein n=1 Tax=Mycobacterium heckeshornense TaxID=110505 RepID=UPI000662579D|nr:hypothetical protein ACT16_06455 [Mycobacterium heckeshornense]
MHMIHSVIAGTAIFLGTAIAAAPIASAEPPSVMVPRSPCSGYINVDGHCVPSPDHIQSDLPDKDGTYSHSEHKQGSGSHHGGTGRSR